MDPDWVKRDHPLTAVYAQGGRLDFYLLSQSTSRLMMAFTIAGVSSIDVENLRKAWADMIECREDIQFERGHEDVIASAIPDLANPTLQGQLNVVAPNVLAALS
ncbi:hypothetical protein [Sinorhizobium meliloti]|uniref:hypothetical protein n=1 Tax=Rhizobium meliloti TaxID=382 RepID=UPI003F15BF92